MLTLKNFYRRLSPEQKTAFAATCDTSLAYLSQVVHRHRAPSPRLARLIHAASGFAVPLSEIRPDIWPAAAGVEKRRAKLSDDPPVDKFREVST